MSGVKVAGQGISMDEPMNDAQWAAVKSFVNPLPGETYRSSKELRKIVDAIRYAQRNNCPWQNLPRTFPPGSKVKQHYHAWQSDGTLGSIASTLAIHANTGSREVSASSFLGMESDLSIIIDRQNVGLEWYRICLLCGGKRYAVHS